MRYDVIMGVVYSPVLWYMPPDKTLPTREIQKKDLFIHKLSEIVITGCIKLEESHRMDFAHFHVSW